MGMATVGTPPYINNAVSTWNALQAHAARGSLIARAMTKTTQFRKRIARWLGCAECSWEVKNLGEDLFSGTRVSCLLFSADVAA